MTTTSLVSADRREAYIKALSKLTRAAHELHQALGYEMTHYVEQEAVAHTMDGRLNNVAFLVEDAKSLVNLLKPGRTPKNG
jgi:hypothetical protein